MGAKRNKQLGSSSLCWEWNKNPPQLFLSVCFSSRTMQLGVMAVTAPFFGAWWIWKKSCWCCSALKTGNISGCWPQDVSEYSCEHLPQLDSECTGTNHTYHRENCSCTVLHLCSLGLKISENRVALLEQLFDQLEDHCITHWLCQRQYQSRQ